MSLRGAQARISQVVTSWPGVTSQPHRFPGTVRQDRCGGVEYVIGKREVGHIHGDHLMDIPFPKKVRDEVVAAGRAQPHHILPETGWISFHLQQESDEEQAIALLRESYEIAIKQKAKTIEVNDGQSNYCSHRRSRATGWSSCKKTLGRWLEGTRSYAGR